MNNSNKIKLLLVISFSFSICFAFAQETRYLIETPVGQSEKETFMFLKGILNGRTPIKQFDNNWGSYDLDNSGLHIEYKIENDTCIIASAHYKIDNGEFEKVVAEIAAKSEAKNGVMVKTSDSGELLTYSFNTKDKVISAFRFKYILKIANK